MDSTAIFEGKMVMRKNRKEKICWNKNVYLTRFVWWSLYELYTNFTYSLKVDLNWTGIINSVLSTVFSPWYNSFHFFMIQLNWPAFLNNFSVSAYCWYEVLVLREKFFRFFWFLFSPQVISWDFIQNPSPSPNFMKNH